MQGVRYAIKIKTEHTVGWKELVEFGLRVVSFPDFAGSCPKRYAAHTDQGYGAGIKYALY